MTKIPTPMQKLKRQMEILESFLMEGFKIKELNKTLPKKSDVEIHHIDGTWGSINTKGVESDYLKIYDLNMNGTKQLSFALAFTFLNIDENKQKVALSFKDKTGKVVEGRAYNFLEFKEKLSFILDKIEIQTTMPDYNRNPPQEKLMQELCDNFFPSNKAKAQRLIDSKDKRDYKKIGMGM